MPRASHAQDDVALSLPDMAGRHRKPSRLVSVRTVALLLCAVLAVTAAGLTAFANDPRLLRAGGLTALFAALLPALLLSSASRVRASSGLQDEVRQLRRDVARLTGALAALPITQPLTQLAPPTAVPAPTTLLSLPLVRAALQVPVQSANGHNGHNGYKDVVDVTDHTLTVGD
jgi:hypothetical protein